MQSSFYVYALIDPRNNQPFYIGKGSGKQGFRRIKSHFYKEGKRGNPLKASVINKIEKLGLSVGEQIMAFDLSEEDAFAVEKIFISMYGRRNIKTGILTNLTDGGEGSSGTVWTEEQRKNKSEWNKAFWKNPLIKEQARQRMLVRIEKNGIYFHSDQNKKKMSVAQQKRFKNTQGTMKGKKHTQEAKDKISKIRKKAGCNLPKEERHRFGSPKEKNYFAKTTIFINPEGQEFKVVGAFRQFITNNGLSLDAFKKYLNKGIIPPAKTNLSKARVKSSGWQIKRS